jgi:hypothetical protein
MYDVVMVARFCKALWLTAPLPSYIGVCPTSQYAREQMEEAEKLHANLRVKVFAA